MTLNISSLPENLAALALKRKQELSALMAEQGLTETLAAAEKLSILPVILFSEFIFRMLMSTPCILKELIDSGDIEKSYSDHTFMVKMESLVHPEMEISAVQETLMAAKQVEAIRIAWRDLAGFAGLEETLQDLSNLADTVLEIALRAISAVLAEKHGRPVDHDGNFQGLIVLGMGKLGARELNFSSDIDLIFVFPENGYTDGESVISNEAFYTKVCRQLVRFFSTEGRSGHFYRLDTRLRPYGDSGPLVMSAAAFEQYYEAQGREWERYAMIKARPVAGDLEAGAELLKMLNSFTYRRYFDYGSFDSFREMKNRISLQVKNLRLQNNIKLGAGGIREIEFFGQLFQLIRGGVEPKLQERGILKVLDLLEESGLINRQTREELQEAYRFLRMVENRLQEYQDRQTHDIPEDPDHRLILALASGYSDWETFESALAAQLGKVHFHFSQLLAEKTAEASDQEILDLKEMWANINDPQYIADAKFVGNFSDHQRVLDILRSLEAHPNTKRLTSNGRMKLARLVPVLIKKVGEQGDPEAILNRLIDLIIVIERRTCYLSLLIENGGALDTLIILARKSPWITGFLSRHPALLDELMHPMTLYTPPDREKLRRQMDVRMSGISGTEDLEILLEELCMFRQVNMLRVAAADVSGNYPLMKVSDHLTWIAEIVLQEVLNIAWRIVTKKYGRPEGISPDDMQKCGFAVVAYGKVGGLEMGYKSDIDLVFLYEADAGMTAGEEKSIENIRFYSNLAQRMVSALTVHTPAGSLYGADMRLRPGGNSGTIVSHVNTFEEYLKTEAWTWEHQALIRARCIAGDASLCKRFLSIRQSMLTQPRDESVKKEVREMRERMREQRLKTGPEEGFDLKQSRGGIVDIEFLVQYLVLTHASEFPDLVIWTDNMRLLEGLDAEGVIDGCESQRLQEAYIIMRKTIHRRNLQEMPLIVEDGQFDDHSRYVREIYEKYFSD